MKFTVTRLKDFVYGILPFIFIILVWQILSSAGTIPNWLFSGPTEAFTTFYNLILDGTLFRLLLISVTNVLPAFIVSVLFSLVLGVTIGVSPIMRKIFMPSLSALYLIPTLAWLPLIILILGFTRQTIWALVFISSFVRMIYVVIGGVRSIDQNWLLVARNLGFSRTETILKVVLPGSLPQIFSGLRIGFGSAWRSLIGAEMLVVTAGGLGKYIWYSQWAYKFDQVLAGIILIGLIGIVFEELIFKRLESVTLAKWHMIE